MGIMEPYLLSKSCLLSMFMFCEDQGYYMHQGNSFSFDCLDYSVDKLAQGKHSQCLVRIYYNVQICSKALPEKSCNSFFCHCPGPSELDNFTDELRGVIPRSFEYLFFLINREVEQVSHKVLSLEISYLILIDSCNFIVFDFN